MTLSRCPTGEPAPAPSGLLALMTPCALDVPAGIGACMQAEACPKPPMWCRCYACKVAGCLATQILTPYLYAKPCCTA